MAAGHDNDYPIDVRRAAARILAEPGEPPRLGVVFGSGIGAAFRHLQMLFNSGSSEDHIQRLFPGLVQEAHHVRPPPFVAPHYLKKILIADASWESVIGMPDLRKDPREAVSDRIEWTASHRYRMV